MKMIYLNKPYPPRPFFDEEHVFYIESCTTLSSIINHFSSKGVTDFSQVTFDVDDNEYNNKYFCVRKEEPAESFQKRLDEYDKHLQKYNKQVDLLEKMKKILFPEEIALLES